MIIQSFLAIPCLLIGYYFIQGLVTFFYKPNEKPESNTLEFYDADYLLACWPPRSSNCKRITHFKISSNHTYSCFERVIFLRVLFKLFLALIRFF